MCEFKIIKRNDGSQIMEDIVIISYNENSELLLRDVIGMGEKLESALILDVNTMNQKCVILENPLIKDFISLIKNLSENKSSKSEIDKIINKLETIKSELKS
ncbi:MAG: CooT family nickel-binding protein [Candidatus Lokiarchaeota archaeon]|nr:CooT family nickel-binding protein [Candidatus Lokiarchaeota archaeon]